MHIKNKGFTLLELLMVITIIALLTAIILVSLSNARDKSNDAKVKSQLARARSSAELFFNNQSPNSYNGSAGNVSSNCTTANSMFTDTVSGVVTYTTIGNYPSGTTLRCSSNGVGYAISASLKLNKNGGDPDFWCVDSKNNAKIIEGNDHPDAHPSNDVNC